MKTEIKVAPSEGMEIETVDENGDSVYVPHWGWHSVLIVNGCASAVKYFDTKEEAEAETWEM